MVQGLRGTHKLEKTSHRNLKMVARLIRLAEALNCSSCTPDAPGADELPEVLEPEEDLDLEARVFNTLYPPLNTIERKEFWRRAYLSKSQRGENGELRVRFDLPPGRLHLYQPWLVTSKVFELKFYLESLPEALKDYGILLGL